MKRTLMMGVAWLGLLSVPTGLLAADLPQLPNDGWVSWRVPMVAQQGDGPCCYELRGGKVGSKGCTLKREGSDGSLIWSAEPHSRSSELVVFALREQGQTRQLHGFAADCQVKLDSPAKLLNRVDQGASLAWMDAQVEQGGNKQVRNAALMVMAQHADDQATQRLIQRSATGQPKRVRHDALFWLGQARGAAGLPTVQSAALAAGDRQTPHHALFVLSQSDLPAAATTLQRVAADVEQSAESRGQALFWMAQSGHPDARPAIETLLRSHPSVQLQDKAVFALSQLEQGADQALIAVIKGDYPRQAKKQALFWLGQSSSDEALRFLEQFLAGQ